MFHLCLSLAHLLTLCHIEATLRREGSTGTDTPALQGCRHSPPPSSPLISSAFALWANAELYILVLSLTPSLSVSLPVSGRNLEISVNIDARTLKFCMRHPWTHSFRFRGNQIVCMSVSLFFGLLPLLTILQTLSLSVAESWKNLSILMLGL